MFLDANKIPYESVVVKLAEGNYSYVVWVFNMWSAEHSLSLIKEGPFVYYELQWVYVGVDSDMLIYILSSSQLYA